MRSKEALKKVVEKLVKTGGVSGVLILNETEPLAEAVSDEAEPDPLLQTVLPVLRVAGKSIRLVVDTLTINAMRIDGVEIIVSYPTGHAVAKSIQRMLRRALRLPGSPAVESSMRRPRQAKGVVRDPMKLPIGTEVVYKPLTGAAVKTKTTSAPWKLEHGSVLVRVEGFESGVLVEHLQVAS